MKSIWSEIERDYFNGKKWIIDGWLTSDQDEEGKTIANIDPITGKVEYVDERAKTDDYAQKIINEVINQVTLGGKKQLLVDAIIEKFKNDIAKGDCTVLDELLMSIPYEKLLASLPEEHQEKFKL